MTKKKSVFETLSAINVNDKTQKKGKLTYLSWAWAWQEVKKLYPDTERVIYKNGCKNYFDDGKTAWVEVGIIINGLEHIDMLPVMDYKNMSIPLDKLTSFDVNKTIQRSSTKALALHGLGLYIYAGEDLPEGYEAPKPKKPKLDDKRLNGALEQIKLGNYSDEKLYNTFDLSHSQLEKVIKFMNELNTNKNANAKK